MVIVHKKFASTILALVASLYLASCRSPEPTQITNWTQQPIELANSLRPGLSEAEVVGLLGNPVTREFQGDGTALQWCRTGVTTQFPRDRFVIGFFFKDRLVGVRNYQGPAGGYGD